jgi:hypothetical protein
MESLTGVWHLCSWSAVWGCEFEGTVDEFLYQDAAAPLSQSDDAGKVDGSTLTIESSGEFSQAGRGQAPVLTYDEGGIQISGVAEFGGTISEVGGLGYLLCRNLPMWATPADPVAQTRLRWDDKDTKVCDAVRLVDGRLVRTICVVTDECYGDRVVLVYER